jgi:hypothetical protein
MYAGKGHVPLSHSGTSHNSETLVRPCQLPVLSSHNPLQFPKDSTKLQDPVLLWGNYL